MCVCRGLERRGLFYFLVSNCQRARLCGTRDLFSRDTDRPFFVSTDGIRRHMHPTRLRVQFGTTGIGIPSIECVGRRVCVPIGCGGLLPETQLSAAVFRSRRRGGVLCVPYTCTAKHNHGHTGHVLRLCILHDRREAWCVL